MTLHVEQWESLAAFLRHIAASGEKELSANHSQTDSPFFGEAGLQEFVGQCQTLTRPDLPARAREIAALAASLTGALPAGVSVRRRPAWGRSGSSVSVQRVLRGNLGQAWRRTERQAQLQDGGGLVLLLPSTIPAVVSQDQIIWSAVASLAVADYARRQGRRVEIWSIGYTGVAYKNGDSHVLCVPLVRAGQVWDASAVCLATYPEWPRRLGFRDREIASRGRGGVMPKYGHAGNAATVLAWAQTQWAPTQGLPVASMHLGCTYEAGVRDRATATSWAQHHLAALAA